MDNLWTIYGQSMEDTIMWQKHVVSSWRLLLRNVETGWEMLKDVERWCWWGYKAARSDNWSFLHIQLFWDTATCYRDNRLKPISPHYYDPRFFMLVNDNTVVFLDISTFNHHQRVSPTNLWWYCVHHAILASKCDTSKLEVSTFLPLKKRKFGGSLSGSFVRL